MRVIRVAIVCASLPLAASGARAQVLASEKGTVSQTVDGTTITVEYYRPVARGRDSLIGKVVRMGEMWTPGANWATTIDVDKDVKVNGQALPKGKYGIWMIPGPGEWTVIFDKTSRAFHTQRPRPESAVLKLTVKTATAPQTDVLTWWFPAVMRDGTTLHLRWGTADVPIHFGVTPTRAIALAVEQRARYAGNFDVTFSGEGAPPRPVRFVVFDSAGAVRMRAPPFDPALDGTSELLPAGEHRFHPLFYSKGVVYSEEPDATIIFLFTNDRLTGFEMHGQDDKVMARGTLVKP